MKRLLIIGTLICTGIFNVSAQETQIDLSKYKLPDMKRQTLEFEFDLNNSFNKNYYSINESDLSKSNYFSSGLDIDYTYYKNSSNWQQELSTIIRIGGYNNEYREYGELDDKTSSVGSSFSLNSRNRYYFSEAFLGFYPLIQSSYYQWSYENLGNSGKGYNSYFDAFVPLHIGYGRIDRVEDARQAAYIYNALVEKAKAKEGKSEEDLLMLAEKISQLKNERFFDARNKKIYELEELDKFLKENGFVEEDDITYFTTLEDMWDYGNTPSRYAGFRASVFVNPGYHIDEDVYRAGNDQSYLMKYYLLKTGVSVDYYKNINMYWQNALSFESYYGLSRNRESGRYLDKQDWRTPGIHIGITDKIGFYPNTRTYLSANIGVNLVKHMDEPKNEDDFENYVGSFKGESLYLNTGLSGYYYFSPQLRVSGAVSLYYRTDVTNPDYELVHFYPSNSPAWNYYGGFSNTKNAFNYSISFALEYYLF